MIFSLHLLIQYKRSASPEIEGIIVYNNPGQDKNFMFYIMPFVGCLFVLLVLNQSKFQGLERLKPYGKIIFLFHLISIELFNYFHSGITPYLGVQRLLLGIFIPMFCLLIYRIIRKYLLRKKRSEFNCIQTKDTAINHSTNTR